MSSRPQLNLFESLKLAVLQITEDGCPSKLSIRENAWGLARYARICQESGLVPIVEPEILMDGDHTIERTAEAQERILTEVYQACAENGVFLEGSLLKPSMTVSGADNDNKAGSEEVAKTTVRTMERCVPAAVPGIMFLSGGLTEEDASVYLNTMNSIDRTSSRSFSFSYGRALQQSCLQAWQGNDIEAGQKALMARKKFVGKIYSKKKSGALFYHRFDLTPVLDAKGELTHYIAGLKEIKQRKSKAAK